MHIMEIRPGPRKEGLELELLVVAPDPVKVKVAQSCLTLCNPMDYSPWNSPGKNTGVGCHSLLQGIFPTQVNLAEPWLNEGEVNRK